MNDSVGSTFDGTSSDALFRVSDFYQFLFFFKFLQVRLKKKTDFACWPARGMIYYAIAVRNILFLNRFIGRVVVFYRSSRKGVFTIPSPGIDELIIN